MASCLGLVSYLPQITTFCSFFTGKDQYPSRLEKATKYICHSTFNPGLLCSRAQRRSYDASRDCFHRQAAGLSRVPPDKCSISTKKEKKANNHNSLEMGDVVLLCLFFFEHVVCACLGESETECTCGDVYLQISTSVRKCMCVCVCVCFISLSPRGETVSPQTDGISWMGGAQTEKERIDVLYTHHCLEMGIFKPPRRILLWALLLHLLECCSVKECITMCCGINWIMNAIVCAFTCVCVWMLNSAPCLFSYTPWLSWQCMCARTHENMVPFCTMSKCHWAGAQL